MTGNARALRVLAITARRRLGVPSCRETHAIADPDSPQMSVPGVPRSVPALRQRRQRPLGVTDPRQPTAKRQGLSQAQVMAAIVAQGGRCAIGSEPLGALVAVDHCHACALRHGHAPERGCPSCFRGITCTMHNTALGAFGDDPAVLRRAAVYVGHGRH